MWLTIFVTYSLAPLSVVFLFRTARPTSWWAERFYDDDKLERSRDLYWSDTSTLATSYDLARRRPLSTRWFGASREQVDGYLARSIAAVEAFETNRPDRVTVPPDLLRKPRFKQRRSGYDIQQTEREVEMIRETVHRLHWLQQAKPWLLHSRPRPTQPRNAQVAINSTWEDQHTT